MKRKDFLHCGLILAIGTVLTCLCLLYGFYRLHVEQYKTVASLLERVKEYVPEFPEEEWISLLSADGDYTRGKLLLEQYGVLEGEALRKTERNFQYVFMVIVVLPLLVTGLCLIGFTFSKQKRMDKEVTRLAAYIDRLVMGDYTLELSHNTEEKLSLLQNELYKVTVVLKEAAEQSAKQRKALADSVSDISHQIKTPLTSVMVLLDNLSESRQMKEETRQRFLAEITGQLIHVNWLVAALLKLSRLDAGVVEFEKETIYVGKLLDKVIEELEIIAEYKQVSIRQEGVNAAAIIGDGRWLGEAFSNILKNALEHSPQGGEVLVTTEENALYTEIRIRDYGNGMTKEEQKHIFERFYQGSYRSEDSTGIGLALAWQIMDKLGGSLTVSSEQGEGTVFIIKFMKS